MSCRGAGAVLASVFAIGALGASCLLAVEYEKGPTLPAPGGAAGAGGAAGGTAGAAGAGGAAATGGAGGSAGAGSEGGAAGHGG